MRKKSVIVLCRALQNAQKDQERGVIVVRRTLLLIDQLKKNVNIKNIEIIVWIKRKLQKRGLNLFKIFKKINSSYDRYDRSRSRSHDRKRVYTGGSVFGKNRRERRNQNGYLSVFSKIDYTNGRNEIDKEKLLEIATKNATKLAMVFFIFLFKIY